MPLYIYLHICAPDTMRRFCCEGGLELNLADGSNHTIRENEYFF